jgi:hypothetical protein
MTSIESDAPESRMRPSKLPKMCIPPDYLSGSN